MKVYSLPKEVPAPVPNYSDMEKVFADEEKHKEQLKAHLIKTGFSGKNTGKTVRFQVADGYAVYMLAEGKTSCLIHLPYGDGYDYRDVQYIPKAEILRRIKADESLHDFLTNKS